MTDIVSDLREYRQELRAMAGQEHERDATPLGDLLKRAADEIEHLRQLAGKVSSGFTFNEIKRDAKNFKEPSAM